MTRLWPAGDPIQVEAHANGLPVRFFWQGAWRDVSFVANRWRIRSGWWETEAWREYSRLVTIDGLLCTIYCDLLTGAWFCARVYD